MTTRADIVARARQELGTRWQHQARLPGAAVDCVGLVGVVALALNLPGAKEWDADDDLKRYGKPPRPDVLLAGARKYLVEISVSAAREGDVVVLAHHKHPTTPQHFGIITRAQPRYVVHAETIAGAVVENRVDDNGRWRPTHAFAFRGVTL